MDDLDKDLMLLERVFLRIGSADSEDQFESCIIKFLAPVLLKLSTPHDAVRNKVVELLTHIKKRLKTYKTMQLPTQELVELYQNATSSFVQNFTIIYIKLGFPRMSAENQLELLPTLFKALEGKPQKNLESIMMLFLESLVVIKVSTFIKTKKDIFEGNSVLKKALLDYMLDVLLFPLGKIDDVPPGMSEHSVLRVVSELSDHSSSHEEKLKLAIIELLASKIFDYKHILAHAVVASKEARSSVSEEGEKLLKELLSSIEEYDNEAIIPLYTLFVGSLPNIQIDSFKRKKPPTPAVKAKILNVLIKIKVGAVIWPACIQIVILALQLNATEAKESKIMSLGFQFANMMISDVKTEQLGKVAGVLLNSTFLKVLTPENDYSLDVVQQAYTSVGLLVKKVPALVKNDLKLVKDFFLALATVDNQETKLVIKEALICMSHAYDKSNVRESVFDELLSLLAEQANTNNTLSCQVVIHYLVNVFPASNAPSRFILLLIAGKSQPDLAAEAKKYLYGLDHKIDSELKFEEMPTFCNMTETVIRELETRSSTSLSDPGAKLPMAAAALCPILSYLSLCLKHSAGIKSVSCDFQHPSNDTFKVTHYLKHLHTSQPKVLSDYLILVQKVLQSEAHAVPLFCLAECAGTIPELVVPQLTIKLDWLETLFGHSREDIRENTALLYGPVISYSLSDTEFDDRIFKICQNSLDSTSKALELQHGTLLAVATAVERRILKQVGCSRDWMILKKIILTAFEFLKQSQPLFLTAACKTFGLLGRVAPLPLVDAKTNLAENPGKLDILEKLIEISDDQKLISKVRLLACKAVGLLCVGDAHPHKKLIIETFLAKAKDHKDVEIHMNVGSTLVCCILGPSHKLARNLWVTSELEFSHSSEDYYPLLDWLLSELLQKATLPNINSKQAVCFWLFEIAKECSHATPVKQRLKSIQSAFVDFLSENNEMVQTVASKGLALVYESGDAKIREELVELLVRQLSEGKRSVTQVTSDTKLFDDGALGKAPTGANLTTYKEICSFASDMNQPDLIYTFLNMANHNATWNSKKGAAFGFSSIAENAREQLKDHLFKIVPRLYRYQFDPNPKTQASMSAIWQSLVPEPSKTIEQYHKEILADLIKNLTSNQYRVRQSCCYALADFLRGAGSTSLETCIDSFPELWYSLFRVMDDVHESTRKEAQKTATIISQLCVRRCDSSKYGKAGEAMIKALLIPILDKGVCSQLSEVRTVSLLTISELVKSSGIFLQSHLTTLIPALLEATDDLELACAYASTKLSADASRQEKFDDFRASLVKSHYTSQTVSKCIQYLTNEVLKELAPRIIELLRGSVSLSTRIATSHFIVLLILEPKSRGLDLQPYSGKLLSALLNGLTDRNSSIRNAYAVAVGHVVKISKDSSVDKLIKKLNTIYLEKEDVKIRCSLGSALSVMMKHSPDILKSQSNILIPLAFYAAQASDKDLKAVWEELWHDIAPSAENSLLRNADAVSNFLKNMLISPSWNEKAQAATGIKTMASKLGDQMGVELRKKLIESILEGISGRTWTGKENLLDALVTLCHSYPKTRNADDNLPNLTADLVLKECRKENLKYRARALTAAGKILHSLEVDRFSAVHDIVQEINAKSAESVVDEGDDLKDKTEKRNSLTALKEAAFIALGEAWPKNSTTQSIYQEKIIAQCVSCLNNSERSIQAAVISALHQYIERSAILENKTGDKQVLKNILAQIHEALNCTLVIKKHSKLRSESLTIILLLSKKLKDSERIEELRQLKQLFSTHYESLVNDTSPEIKCRVADIKTYFETNA